MASLVLAPTSAHATNSYPGRRRNAQRFCYAVRSATAQDAGRVKVPNLESEHGLVQMVQLERITPQLDLVPLSI